MVRRVGQSGNRTRWVSRFCRSPPSSTPEQVPRATVDGGAEQQRRQREPAPTAPSAGATLVLRTAEQITDDGSGNRIKPKVGRRHLLKYLSSRNLSSNCNRAFTMGTAAPTANAAP